MVRASRYSYVVTAWLVVVGLIGQVLLIGLGLPPLGNSPSSIETHGALGWLIHLTPILVIPLAFLAAFVGFVLGAVVAANSLRALNAPLPQQSPAAG